MKKIIILLMMCLISISMIAQGYNTSHYGANSNFAISAGVVQPRLYHTEGISTFNISYHGGISTFIYTSTSAIIEPGVNFVYKYSSQKGKYVNDMTETATALNGFVKFKFNTEYLIQPYAGINSQVQFGYRREYDHRVERNEKSIWNHNLIFGTDILISHNVLFGYEFNTGYYSMKILF